ncbi:MAG TPA: class I SAM-dependent methyltransferase [Candidatus Limnocylindrales bacterium]|nr:class I SAM-dependent methyltransferase [Candidatus Limnocylindrales bacterium]
MKRTDPTRIVAAGYDTMAERYLAWSALRPSPARLRYLALADELIPQTADVLELGCGAGLPMTANLAIGRRLTGVDISAVQIGLARVNVPSATFLVADLSTLDLPPASFDAVVAFYSLTHVPRAGHAGLFGRIRSWLRPGGLFLASLGVEDSPDEVETDWLGVDMFFSHFSARVNRRLVSEAGLVIERAEIATEPEDRHDARFLWVVARAPGTRP